MLTPEKNDIDISRLFKWGKLFEISDRYGKKILDVYIRLAGDADINRARTFALRKARELREALKKESSDERLAFVSPIYDVEESEKLLELIVLRKISEFSEDATKVVYVPFPPEPKSDATQEEQENYQKAVDDYPSQREKAINEYIMKRVEAWKEDNKQRKLDSLQKEYEKLWVDYLCEQEMIVQFRDYCVWASTYSDAEFKYKMFSSIEEYTNLPSEIKKQLLDNYNSLELNVDELKKSLGVMP